MTSQVPIQTYHSADVHLLKHIVSVTVFVRAFTPPLVRSERVHQRPFAGYTYFFQVLLFRKCKQICEFRCMGQVTTLTGRRRDARELPERVLFGPAL